MRLAPVEQTKVFRIPGVCRWTKVEVRPYFDLRHGVFVKKQVKSVEWASEPFLTKVLLDPVAICTALTII